MDKPKATMTQEQRTELFELYKHHADWVCKISTEADATIANHTQLLMS